MMTIKTYLKKNNQFILIENFNFPLDDSFYIEGALELTINGIDLISIEMWDCIDQLWAYFIDGLVAVKNNKTFTFYFPDQPIKVFLLPISDINIMVSVTCNNEQKTIVSKKEFLDSMQKSARDFLKYIVHISPEEKENSEKLLKELDSII